MRISRLFLSTLFILILEAKNDAPTKGCAPLPFACYVHKWEETRNNAKLVKHAFDTAEFFNKNCQGIENCKTPCPETGLQKWVVIQDVKGKGLEFKCDPTNLFCKTANEDNCIPIRKVKRFSEQCSSTSKPNQEKQELEKRHARHVAHKHRARRGDSNATTPSQASSKPLADLIEIETIVLPVCRREDTEEECKALTKERFCTMIELSGALLGPNPLPWDNKTKICTVVESPLSGDDPKWFAEHIVTKSLDTNAMKTIWQYTGMPLNIVTDNNTPFLPYRFDKNPMACKKYEKNTDHCVALPLCDKDTDSFAIYSAERPGGSKKKFTLKMKTTQACEKPCNDWDDPTTSQCRILDIKDLPLFRQGSPPYAEFMSHELNLRKQPSNDPANKSHAIRPSSRVKRDAPGNELNIHYPRPLDVETLENEDKLLANDNYWLSPATNPFYLKYGDKINLVKASKCDSTSTQEENYCVDVSKAATRNMDKDSNDIGSFPDWAVFSITVGILAFLCCYLAAIVVIIVVLCKKKTKGKMIIAEESKSPSTKEAASKPVDQQPLLEQSTALNISQTEPTAL